MTAKKLLNKFIQQHKSMALVVDEFGGTAGIVTLEDIMEEIFGEIEDEHDTQNLIEKQLSSNSYLFSGRLEIDHLKDKYNINIPESEEYETIAGFVVVNIGHIPKEGEEIKIETYNIVIKKAQSSRIELLQLTINRD